MFYYTKLFEKLRKNVVNFVPNEYVASTSTVNVSKKKILTMNTV